MKIAIIGAGAAGISAARHCSSNGIKCTVYEQNGEIGGTWVYTDDVGTNKYGLPVHSSMYKGLMTNLPKEVMGFPDFPIPERNESYLKQEDVLEFLNQYVDNFNLKPYIQFYKYVEKVSPNPSGWTITSIDIRTKEKSNVIYDAIMICNGHYSDPRWPNIPGLKSFKGHQLHCHDYRTTKIFEEKNVLIIGSGPSAIDVTLQAQTVAKKVILSHHPNELADCEFPKDIVIKVDVEKINQDGVWFKDDTKEEVDVICYCTGYKYSFPFLHETCKITIDDNYIKPLYKHMINIEYPTMCFVGIPFNVCAFHMFDLQARYFLKILKTGIPTKEVMYRHTEEEMNRRWKRGYKKWQAHLMGENQSSYYDDLAAEASIKTIASVIVKLRQDSEKRITKDLLHFRNDIYKIIDDKTYIKINQ